MTLDEQYQQAIDDQRAYLLKLQDDFNKICETAKETTADKLKALQKDDKEGREAVMTAQKAELSEALHNLKVLVDVSTKRTMRKLEEIMRQKEQQVLADLEKQMAAL